MGLCEVCLTQGEVEKSTPRLGAIVARWGYQLRRPATAGTTAGQDWGRVPVARRCRRPHRAIGAMRGNPPSGGWGRDVQTNPARAEESSPVRGSGAGPQATNEGIVVGGLLEEEGRGELERRWVLDVQEDVGDDQRGEDNGQGEHALDKGGQQLALGVPRPLHQQGVVLGVP